MVCPNVWVGHFVGRAAALVDRPCICAAGTGPCPLPSHALVLAAAAVIQPQGRLLQCIGRVADRSRSQPGAACAVRWAGPCLNRPEWVASDTLGPRCGRPSARLLPSARNERARPNTRPIWLGQRTPRRSFIGSQGPSQPSAGQPGPTRGVRPTRYGVDKCQVRKRPGKIRALCGSGIDQGRTATTRFEAVDGKIQWPCHRPKFVP